VSPMAANDDPASVEAFTARAAQNTRVEGYGLETRMISACPFCGAPDFMTWYVLGNLLAGGTSMEETMQTPTTCAACGRSGRWQIARSDNSVRTSLVQTGGPDVPPWYTPPPRREGRDDDTSQ
jgi:hypothetical protein